MLKILVSRSSLMRNLIQWIFLAWTLGIGVRFGLFVRHFETAGSSPLVSRPPGVEGFLPIGALASLKQWLLTGVVNPLHPAALVLLLTFLALALLAKKSFCSWLCPVGTLSEGAWRTGRRLFGRTFRIWGWLDLPLRGLKYLLLGFFVKIILVDMSLPALQAFLGSPYWAISDVKMLHFFTRLSATALAVIAALTLLSVLYQNFWCRYLCPYGALLGLLSMLSPLKIRRDLSSCTDCAACSRACPSRLPVAERRTIHSPECTGCLTCTEACPSASLAIGLPLWKRTLPVWGMALVVVGLFAGGVLTGMGLGLWESSLTYADYQRLIPLAGRLGH